METKKLGEYIYNHLPNPLTQITENYCDRDKDIVLLSSLSVISSCLPNIYGEYDGNKIFANIYVVIIAPAASGKGVMNHARLIIEPIHEKILKDSQKARDTWDKKKDEEKKNEVRPQIEIKILPANISTSEMYSFLNSCRKGLIIIESEADTLSNNLKHEWGDYSDLLRKAFHHETMSISRTINDKYMEIYEPKLSLLISGTPEQLLPLIKSRENGLFSRLIVYTFDEISPFKNVFKKDNGKGKEALTKLSKKLIELYGYLLTLKEPIEFSFTKEQQKKFLNRVGNIREEIIENHSLGFISNVHRHGLILFRIAMILTTLRNIDNLKNLKKLVCSDEDFILSLELVKILLNHSHSTYNSIDNGYLSIQDEELIDSVDRVFTRTDLINKGKRLNIPLRTIDDKISQLKKKKIIKKLNRYQFQKL